MSTISVTNINDGDAVTAASVNNQINTIVNDYNGGVTAANLASSSVTTAKITDANVTPAKWTNPYKFAAWRTTAYTTVSATFTAFPFDTEEFDTNNNFDSTTNKGRYTAPVSGFYWFAAGLSFPTITRAIVSFYKNGSSVRRGNDFAPSSSQWGVQVTSLLQLTAGDYVEAYYFTSGAVSANTGEDNAYFTGFLVTVT